MADKVIAVNKKAAFEYFIEESFEAGIVLSGCEVKSARGGNVNLSDSFCFFEKGEPMLKNCYIAAYEQGSYNNADTRRDRKLLLHKRQIARLLGKIKEKGYALIFYFHSNTFLYFRKVQKTSPDLVSRYYLHVKQYKKE